MSYRVCTTLSVEETMHCRKETAIFILDLTIKVDAKSLNYSNKTSTSIRKYLCVCACVYVCLGVCVCVRVRAWMYT